MMTDHVSGDDDEAMSRQELEHSRVPCFHAHCRCDTKLPNPDNQHADHPRAHRQRRHEHHVVHREPHRYDHDDEDDDLHHNHHHIHHHHHHHHNELHSSSLSSSARGTTARSFQVGSLHRLLTLFVFLLAWAAVCGAPRRTGDGSLSRYNLETEHTNSLFFDNDSSHPMAAISSVETLLQTPPKSPEAENAKDTSANAAAAETAATSGSSPSTLLKTGSEPAMRMNANAVPSPLDSVNMMPGVFPGYMSQRVVFSAERPQTPPWPGDISFKPEAFDEEGDSANTTDDSEVAHSRRRRSSSVSDLEEVCESTSGWVVKKWGTDMYGQNVTILSEIMTAGNIQVTQWFYETACARPHGVQTCFGIDNNNYDSVCLTKSAWVYAMIRTARGEEGWTWIAISSSCNCAVRRLSLLEQIGRRSRLTRL